VVPNHVRVIEDPIAYVACAFSWLIKENKLIRVHGKRNFKTQGSCWWEQQVLYQHVSTHFAHAQLSRSWQRYSPDRWTVSSTDIF
jgi:hypothetical protein